MFPTRNLDAIRRVQQSELRGEPIQSRKHIYFEQNAFDVGLDTPIYRIFQLKFVSSDIENNQMTFVRAHADSWGDDYENPLLRASFPDPVTGGSINLDGVVGDFYALSWTSSNQEKKEAWDEFSHGNPSVRIESTPRLLLDRLMDVSDPWFMLRFYIGEVKYKTKTEIDAWVNVERLHSSS